MNGPEQAPYAIAVDDNPVVLLHVVDLLESMGFSVFAAQDVAGGQAWLDRFGEHVSLLFTNVDLPGETNGFQFARAVALSHPTLAIVVSSGRISPKIGDMPEDAIFLPKPFCSEEVHQSVQSALNGKDSNILAALSLEPSAIASSM